MKSEKTKTPGTVDESAESEITIQPDGRVFAFGVTRTLATVLGTLPMADDRMRALLTRIASINGEATPPCASSIVESE